MSLPVRSAETSLLRFLRFKFMRPPKSYPGQTQEERDRSIAMSLQDLEAFFMAFEDRCDQVPHFINPLDTTFTSNAAVNQDFYSWATRTNSVIQIETQLSMRRQTNNECFGYRCVSAFKNIAGTLTKISSTGQLATHEDNLLAFNLPIHVVSGTSIVLRLQNGAAIPNGELFDLRAQHLIQEHIL